MESDISIQPTQSQNTTIAKTESASQTITSKSLKPVLLLIFGILQLFYFTGQAFICIQLINLYISLGTITPKVIIGPCLVAVFLIYSLYEIVVGIKLFTKQKHTTLTNTERKKALYFLLIPIILISIESVYFIISIIEPIYSLISQIK